MAYSTCTFNTAENEEMIERILMEYPDMGLKETKRLWPHLERGEGHFVAVLTKSGSPEAVSESSDSSTISNKFPAKSRRGGNPTPVQSAWAGFLDWAKQDIPGFELSDGKPILFGEELYWLPVSDGWAWNDQQLTGLKMPRAGLHLAHLKKNRVEPAHALAMSLKHGQVARSWDLAWDSAEVAAYLRGEVLSIPSEYRGWTLVTTDGFPLGWGKASGGQLKNHLPKGLRNPK